MKPCQPLTALLHVMSQGKHWAIMILACAWALLTLFPTLKKLLRGPTCLHAYVLTDMATCHEINQHHKWRAQMCYLTSALVCIPGSIALAPGPHSSAWLQLSWRHQGWDRSPAPMSAIACRPLRCAAASSLGGANARGAWTCKQVTTINAQAICHQSGLHRTVSRTDQGL